MNRNFAGAPDGKDLIVLDQLRQQFVSMIATMDKLKKEMEFRMSRGEAVDWPQIHRSTALVASNLASFTSFLHGGYAPPIKDKRRIVVQAVKKAGGDGEDGDLPSNEDDPSVVVKKGKEDPKPDYSRRVMESHAERIEALHPFPMPPFPITGVGANMINTMLRKRLEPKEEEWVDERLSKASEFAHVPAEWNIEPKKPNAQKEEKGNEDGEYTDPGKNSTKRTKGTLTEDDFLELWKNAHKEVFDQPYLRAKYPDEFGGEGEGAEDEDEEDDDEDDEDEDDFENVMDTSDAPVKSEVPVATEDPEKAAVQVSEPTSNATRAAVAFVHPPVPGLPVLAMGFVHKFMSCGEIS